MLTEIEKYINDNNNKPVNELYKLLINNYKSEIENAEIRFIMYDKFNYIDTDIDNDIDNETYDEKINRRDKEFKKKVEEYYNGFCVITGHSMTVCEIAHIYPFAEAEINEKYDPDNGIVLDRSLHVLFDKNLLTIDPTDYKLILSQKILNDNSLKYYHQYHNKKLNIKKESKKYFEKLYNKNT